MISIELDHHGLGQSHVIYVYVLLHLSLEYRSGHAQPDSLALAIFASEIVGQNESDAVAIRNDLHNN